MISALSSLGMSTMYSWPFCRLTILFVVRIAAMVFQDAIVIGVKNGL
jgi:hypothetical protein